MAFTKVDKSKDDQNQLLQQQLERREEAVNALGERFLEDFGLLLGGDPRVRFEYMDGVTSQLLRTIAAPFLATGERMKPDFGEWVSRYILDNDDREPNAPIHVRLSFTDASAIETKEGGRKRNPREEITIELLVTGDGREIRSVNMWRGKEGAAPQGPSQSA